MRKGKVKMWITLNKYTEITGDTRDAVHARRQKGVWADGIHCKVVHRRLWINMSEVEKWLINYRQA